MDMNLIKKSMIVGALFMDSLYDDERTEEWCGSEECSLFTDLMIKKADECKISIEEAFELYSNEIVDDINKIEKSIDDYMWNEYCKGFLAGEILGLPNKTNIKLLNEAEELWENEEYGYYQEVLNEVK